MATVLIADDQQMFRDDARKMLETEKTLRIVEASNPEEALDYLRSDEIDVAVVDHRLRGQSPIDDSGLKVAELANPRIPIILVSQFEDRKPILSAINTRPDGYPLVVRFLDKKEIRANHQLLLSTVRSALKKREIWSKTERERIHPELLGQYRSDRKWSHIYQALHYLTSLVFVILMIHASLGVGARLVPLLFTMIAILAGEITNIIISQREGSIARRADKNHAEILQAARFSQLLDACSSIVDLPTRDAVKSALIKTASQNWLLPEVKGETRALGGIGPIKSVTAKTSMARDRTN